MAKQIKFNIRLSVDGKEQLVTATTNVKDLKKNLSALKNGYKGLSDEVFKFNQSIQAIQNISGVLNSITQESRDFGAAMKAANTMAGKGGEEFEQLKDQVAELSKTIPMARDQLANGLYQVISNGVPEDNWISYLEASAKSAVGGIADVGEVVKVTSTVIKNYGLEWSAAQDIQDKIQLTAKNGVTSFEQLAAALPSVTGQAAQLGVSFTEMLAVMSTLTGVTGNTAEVSTQLASVLTALTKESSKSQKMAEKMGISFNAASIKAAGGLQQFLVQLDQTITAYAAKTGELKESIYSKLFGRAEALRLTTALTGELSGKFAENITALENSAGTIDRAFETMSSTGGAAIQMLKNQYAAFTDLIAGVVGAVQPYLTFGAQLGMTLMSVSSLTKAMKSLSLTHAVLRANVTRTAAAFLAFGGNAGKMSAALRVMSAAARGAAFQATALKIALRGLLTATGVGIALAALGVIIEKLCNNTEEAVGPSEKLSESEEAYKNAAAGAKVKIDEEIKSLGNLIKEKKNTAEAVKHLNDEYGGIFGKHKAASEWYDILTAKSKAYCKQLGYEAQIKILSSKQAEKQIELDQNTEKRQALVKSGKHQKTVNTTINAYNPTAAIEYTPEYNGMVNDAAKLTVELKGIEARLEAARRGMEQASSELGRKPATENGGAGGKSETESETEKEEKKRLNVELEAIDTWHLQEQNKILRSYNEGKLQDEKEYNALLLDLEQQTLDKKLSISELEPKKRAELEKQKLENIKKRSDECKKEEEEAAKAEAQTYLQTLQKELEAAQKNFDNATTVEAKVEAAANVSEIQAKIDQQTNGKLTIPAKVAPTYVVEGSDEDKRQSYGNAETQAAQLLYDYEIGIKNKDEVKAELAEINAGLENLNLKPITLQLESKGLKQAEKALGDMKQAWGGVSGISDGITGITAALECNGTAWEKISACMSGFFQIAEGIMTVVKLIDTLTAATTGGQVASQASTATKAVETSVTTASAEATTLDTAAIQLNTQAALANTAAKSGEAVAEATKSGAKLPFPANIAAIAAGVAAVVSALSIIGSFSTGGIVGGASPTGDKMLARVNSGEMILNKQQQTNLLKMLSTPAFADGGVVSGPTLALVGEYSGANNNPEVIAPLDRLRSMIEPAGLDGSKVRFEIEGRKLVGVIEKEYSMRRRS